jgi:ABC-type phosphate/phosphonate transport system substrate-binding protein
MEVIKLMVCPHDTVRNPEGWYRLIQYMTARFNLKIHFEICLDFADFHAGMDQADVVYANPSDAVKLIDRSGFKPLARPADTFDEALVVVGPDGPLPSLEAINGATVASVENLLPTRIALKMLRSRGLIPASIAHRDSWLSVVRSVWNGEAPFGILYRDAYNDLSPQGREMIRVLESTDERAAFHMFVARPEIQADLAALLPAFTDMGSDPEGAAVLGDLGIPKWIAATDDDLVHIREILA